MAQAICDARPEMSDHLENLHFMNNVTMRSKLMLAGVSRLDSLHKLSDDYIHKACQAIRKQGGPSPTKEITMRQEETLHQLVRWCKH